MVGRTGVPGSVDVISQKKKRKKSETYDTFWKGQAIKCDGEEGRKRDMQLEFLAVLDHAGSLVLSYGV